jgi:uncharacterized membrane-anchored protein YitT (DUF2179 family)
MKGFALLPLALILNSCAGGAHGAGYWFHFIFIVIPLIVIGFLLLKKSETISDSLYTIEGQLKRLSSRLDNLEEKVKKLTEEEQREDKKPG